MASGRLRGLLQKRWVRVVYLVVVFGLASYLNDPTGPWLPFLALGALLLAALMPLALIRPDDAT
jgi:hypothetical protein